MSSETKRAVYQMSPAEDYVIFGEELTEGMWVLKEASFLRSGSEAGEDGAIRGQRFCEVTRLRRRGDLTVFIGRYADGFQKVFGVHKDYGWIVKREHPSEPEVPSSPVQESATEEKRDA